MAHISYVDIFGFREQTLSKSTFIDDSPCDRRLSTKRKKMSLRDYDSKSILQVLVIFDNAIFFNLHYFLYLVLHCYDIVYRYTSGKSRGTLLKYTVLSLVTLRKIGKLPSPTHFASSLRVHDHQTA